MDLFGWLKGKARQTAGERKRWKDAWTAAIDSADGSQVEPLRAALAPLQEQAGDDVEVELEMLDGLEQLAAVHGASALPIVETQHRVIAGERCHFSAPASLPDDPSQASGRVLFTPSRSIFVGGARTQPLAWHTVKDAIRAERDVLFVRGDGSAAAHLRFNTYGDAVLARYLALRLKGARPTRDL